MFVRYTLGTGTALVSDGGEYLAYLYGLDGDTLGSIRRRSFAYTEHPGCRARFLFGLENHNGDATTVLGASQ
jgi:hypothetical protein